MVRLKRVAFQPCDLSFRGVRLALKASGKIRAERRRAVGRPERSRGARTLDAAARGAGAAFRIPLAAPDGAEKKSGGRTLAANAFPRDGIPSVFFRYPCFIFVISSLRAEVCVVSVPIACTA